MSIIEIQFQKYQEKSLNSKRPLLKDKINGLENLLKLCKIKEESVSHKFKS